MTTFLTFLGIGRYETVTYFWGDKAAQPTHLFPIAATELFAPERIVVFVTPQARESDHFKALSTALGDKLKPVDIPEGCSEAELWEIFDQVAGAVGEGQTVILDITHAFRSIPLVVFTVASYLRRTKKVTVRHILYGAYEARKPDNTLPESKGLVPVFDLSPLVDLLDWTSGAEALRKRGDAELIADNMTTTHQTLRHTKKGEPTRLKALGKRLKEFSQALHLSRPREVMRVAHEFLELLEEARGEFEKWAKPFVLLAEEIRRDLEPLAFAESDVLSRDNLDRQFRLVEYYLAKGLLVQAVTLARECIVSWAALQIQAIQKGDGDWLDRTYRERTIEESLNKASRRLRGEAEEEPEWFAQLPNNSEVAQLWNWVSQLRNDLAHCGMSKQAASIESVKQRARELPARLKTLMKDVPDQRLYGGRVVIELKSLYGEVAELDELPGYLERAKDLAGEGKEVVLTGQAPIWLYLAVAHALHGKARRLLYDSPVTGEVCIFDHSVR